MRETARMTKQLVSDLVAHHLRNTPVGRGGEVEFVFITRTPAGGLTTSASHNDGQDDDLLRLLGDAKEQILTSLGGVR